MPRLLRNALFFLLLAGCGGGGTDEADPLSGAADSPFCPTPFQYQSKSRLCETATEALGPFPEAMIKKCREFGGGEGCDAREWAVSMARSTRGSAVCPLGAVFENGLCTDQNHAYGPFSLSHAAACRKKGGGAACDSMRWDLDFALSSRPQDPFTFPLSGPALADYTEPPRSFGSCRDDCTRRHAAADLYAGTGTLIRAVSEGEVIDFYEFYLGTYALVIDHGSFIVRYGEITGHLPAGIRIGERVRQGQGVAYVGRLIGLNQDMLHFERFAGWATGPLTLRDRYPYQRRADLVNPTQDLLAWKYPL
ncbi:MAG TPA: M23 family metallopeptidase [Oligoflexus sp.]|uniref:M23 family metallopeptidase n=1 Tax=Oligoflexus sp. TaxID=1971216 RepID=UPI002D7EAD25|nr:M23 family metallopeptidase [Oligoflexus sp.]HET9237583.1 M23 family metallopeptidase [Oligoflexus sp.]